MYYIMHGECEPLVIICGTGATMKSYLARELIFTTEHQVVLSVNRGAGRTGKPDLP